MTALLYCITIVISVFVHDVITQGAGYHYTGRPTLQEYCIGKPLLINCRPKEVIVMVNATFGRMNIHSKCVNHDMGYIGCSTDVLKITDKYCSGKRDCNMMVPNDDLDNVQKISKPNGHSCYSELKSYLEASHICVRVLKPASNRCHSPLTIRVSSHGGVISSDITDESRCGNMASPYILEAQKGQILNITLTDFGWDDNPSGNCDDVYAYGFIKDPTNSHKIDICGGKDRHRHMYLSTGPKVQIVLFERENRKYEFLLHYETIGCPDLIPPKHAWMTRDKNDIVIGCNHKVSRQTWHLKCNGHNWIGVIGNCTQQIEAAKQAALKAASSPAIPPEIAILIIIGIAILISLVIIIVGLVLLNRYKRKGTAQASKIYQTDRQIYEEPKYKLRQPVYDGSPSKKSSGKKNEYTHIWEYPLPEPCSAHGNPATITHNTSTGNYDLSREQPQNTHDHYGGSLDSKTTTDSLSRYYALDQTPQDVNTVFHTSVFT